MTNGIGGVHHTAEAAERDEDLATREDGRQDRTADSEEVEESAEAPATA